MQTKLRLVDGFDVEYVGFLPEADWPQVVEYKGKTYAIHHYDAQKLQWEYRKLNAADRIDDRFQLVN